MRPHTLSALVLACSLLTPALSPSAHAAAPKAASAGARSGATAHDETAALRRTLASALVVKAMNPTAEQKKELQRAIADLRGVREAAKNDKDTAVLQDRRKAALAKAIDEARATGSVSAATKAELKDLREDGKDERGDVRKKAKESMDRIRATLTPEQLAAVRDLADDMPQGRGARQGAGKDARKGAGGKHSKGMLLRLMMSDEFAAELAR